MKKVAFAAALLAMTIPSWAQGDDSVAERFAAIDAGSVLSADLVLPEITDPADLVKEADGRYTSRGILPPKRLEKHCALDSKQVGTVIRALKRAKPDERDPNGVGADIVIYFYRSGSPRLVAVVGSPKEAFGGATPIYLDGAFALLSPADRDAVRVVATAAGCTP